MSHTWDPDRYLTYADERGRPFVELLARVGAADPRAVVDLGCGPGNLTALLAERWPAAAVSGVDSSPDMIAAARSAPPPIAFEVGDLRDWTPPATWRTPTSAAGRSSSCSPASAPWRPAPWSTSAAGRAT